LYDSELQLTYNAFIIFFQTKYRQTDRNRHTNKHKNIQHEQVIVKFISNHFSLQLYASGAT
jgi:hypothetical protein